MREGGALLQGLAICGRCGRKLRTHFTGRTASPGYHCAGKNIVEGRGCYCLNVGAMQIDETVMAIASTPTMSAIYVVIGKSPASSLRTIRSMAN